MTALIEQLTDLLGQKYVRIRNCIIDVSVYTSNIWSAIHNYTTSLYPLNTIKYACALYKIIALNKLIVLNSSLQKFLHYANKVLKANYIIKVSILASLNFYKASTSLCSSNINDYCYVRTLSIIAWLKQRYICNCRIKIRKAQNVLHNLHLADKICCMVIVCMHWCVQLKVDQ